MKPILSAILSVNSTSLSDDEKRLFERANPLGVSLFSRNIQSIKQTKNLIAELKEVVGREDFIVALDQEGGRVNRLQKAGFKKYASESILAEIGNINLIEAHAILISADMHTVGANFNFAPLLDIDYQSTTIALKSRTFGSDKNKVARYGQAMWQTYLKNGICPCIKHIPGHGRAKADPHLGLPVIEADLKQMERDFYPFIQNNKCPAAMTAHILLKKIDNKNPITFSQKCINEIIRTHLNFQGFLISDALEMHALNGNLSDRMHRALDAGCDAVCYCLGKTQDIEELCAQKAYLSDRSLERLQKITEIFYQHKPQTNLDFIQKQYYTAVNLFAEEKVDYDATEVLFQLQKGEK